MNIQGKILVVNDSQETSKQIREALFNMHEIFIASSGFDALKKLSNDNYDLIICDTALPDMDGFEMYERVRHTIDATIPVILTARDTVSKDKTLEAIKVGIADLLRSPFNEIDLINIVGKQLTKSSSIGKIANNTQHIVCTRYCFEFTPKDYIRFNIADYLITKIVNIQEITSSTANILSLIIEEMVSNAFIHGTFKIGKERHELDPCRYKSLIMELLKNPDIEGKTVCVNIHFSRKNNTLSITVADQGDGFDSHRYLDKSVGAGNGNGFDSNSLKGLSLIKLLADKVLIFKKGKTIKIEKKIVNNGYRNSN